jgi:hypothetical protein
MVDTQQHKHTSIDQKVDYLEQMVSMLLKTVKDIKNSEQTLADIVQK